MAERIRDTPDPPSVLVRDGGRLRGTGGHRSPLYLVRIVDDEEHPTGGTIDPYGVEALHLRGRRGDPDGRNVDRELRDDVVALSDLMNHGRDAAS